MLREDSMGNFVMKIFIIASLTFLALGIPGWAQEDVKDPIEYSNRIIELENRVSDLEGGILNDRLEFASQIIESQDAMFSRFTIFFEILLILLSIAVPLLIYFLGYRPAHKAKEELQKAFNEYMDKFQIEQMQRALEHIDTDDEVLRIMSYRYLANNMHFDFTEEQLARIHRVLTISDFKLIDDKDILEYALSSQQSNYADKYFLDTLSSNGKIACLYFTKYGFDKYIDEIIKSILSTKVKLDYVVKWIVVAANKNYQNLHKLINHEYLIKQLPIEELEKVKNYLEDHKKFYDSYPGIDLKNTILYSTISKNRE